VIRPHTGKVYQIAPAILEPDSFALWLKPKSLGNDLRELLAPPRDDLLEILGGFAPAQ
jgi:hypothetical protein